MLRRTGCRIRAARVETAAERCSGGDNRLLAHGGGAPLGEARPRTRKQASHAHGRGPEAVSTSHGQPSISSCSPCLLPLLSSSSKCHPHVPAHPTHSSRGFPRGRSLYPAGATMRASIPRVPCQRVSPDQKVAVGWLRDSRQGSKEACISRKPSKGLKARPRKAPARRAAMRSDSENDRQAQR